jgi:hypothetical protein
MPRGTANFASPAPDMCFVPLPAPTATAITVVKRGATAPATKTGHNFRSLLRLVHDRKSGNSGVLRTRGLVLKAGSASRRTARRAYLRSNTRSLMWAVFDGQMLVRALVRPRL